MYTHKGVIYSFKFTCKYCGKIGYSNREWQKFCSKPEKCRDKYWRELRLNGGKLLARVSKLEDKLREIKKDKKGGGKND